MALEDEESGWSIAQFCRQQFQRASRMQRAVMSKLVPQSWRFDNRFSERPEWFVASLESLEPMECSTLEAEMLRKGCLRIGEIEGLYAVPPEHLANLASFNFRRPELSLGDDTLVDQCRKAAIIGRIEGSKYYAWGPPRMTLLLGNPDGMQQWSNQEFQACASTLHRNVADELPEPKLWPLFSNLSSLKFGREVFGQKILVQQRTGARTLEIEALPNQSEAQCLSLFEAHDKGRNICGVILSPVEEKDPDTALGVALPEFSKPIDSYSEVFKCWVTKMQKRVGVEAGWRSLRGENVDISKQVIAVLDTPVFRHVALPAFEEVDVLANVPWNFSAMTWDDHALAAFHGTASAGLALAQDCAIRGIAPGCKLISIKIMRAPLGAKGDELLTQGPMLALAHGIVRAVELGATVVSMSFETPALGSWYDSKYVWVPGQTPWNDRKITDERDQAKVVHDVIRWATRTKKVVIVAAAGNITNKDNGPTGIKVSLPARFREVLSVASSAAQAGFLLTPSIDFAGSRFLGNKEQTNLVQAVDLAAPGIGVVTTLQDKSSVRYGQFRETSASAPQVAGAVAVLRANRPDLAPCQIRDILRLSALEKRPVENPSRLDWRENAYSIGELDIEGMLTAAARWEKGVTRLCTSCKAENKRMCQELDDAFPV